MAIWDALFPGMNPENIIKDGIPKFVQGINLLKLPNVDAEKNFPTNIAEYEQLGWIDPRLMSN